MFDSSHGDKPAMPIMPTKGVANPPLRSTLSLVTIASLVTGNEDKTPQCLNLKSITSPAASAAFRLLVSSWANTLKRQCATLAAQSSKTRETGIVRSASENASGDAERN